MTGNLDRIDVFPSGRFTYGNRTYRCALGRGGVRRDKTEGDGATPVGEFPLRRVMYRDDRTDQPGIGLPTEAIDPKDGWCDDPEHPAYNTKVRLPLDASHERLWRDDHLYDLIVVLGYNDDPVVAGKGSAIFLHVAAADYAPTEGCIALAMADLQGVLRAISRDTVLRVHGKD